MEKKSWCKQKLKLAIYCVVLIGFLEFSLLIGGDFTIEGIRTVANSYITINTAILAVAFAAIIIKHRTDEHKPTLPKNYYTVIQLTAVGIFSSIYTLFFSYVSVSRLYLNKLLFGFATAFTFIAILSMICLMNEFNPEKE
jgi:small-conductance mechanosensitive channel